MIPKYSEAFIEQAVVKAYSRDNRSIKSVAQDLHIKYHTLKYWMKIKAGTQIGAAMVREKRPQDWSAAEQLAVLQEAYGLSGEALQALCRERGIFAHHLTDWKAAFCAQAKEPAGGEREVRTLKDEIAKLKRDVARKDRALAEAAALLILQKKFRALWEDEA